MCGIAGILNKQAEHDVNHNQLHEMLAILQHRGPDDQGTLVDRNIGLGHVRLSIIDLSKDGHQPLYSRDRKYCIIFNGEIYNYIEIKKELEGKYTFSSKTDTEVILAAYLQWGKGFLHKLNGDFSFVIYNLETREIFGARDRYGIKPLYYFNNADTFCFASEIKALLPVLKSNGGLDVNYEAIFNYMVYSRTDYDATTFFSQIKKIPHGHYFTWSKGELVISRWYHLEEEVNKHDSDIAPDEYLDELVKSVRLRLRSDVPLGISLSGGLDSSAITSVVKRVLGVHDLRTFSATYGKGIWADESEYIDAYRNEIEHMKFTVPNSGILLNDIDKFVNAHNEPVSDLGPYGQFKVMELASKDVTVTLDGQGADEQLGGYHNFFGSYYLELLRQLKVGLFTSELQAYYKKHKRYTPLSYLLFYAAPVSLKNKLTARNKVINSDFFNSYKDKSKIAQQLYSPKTLNQSLLDHFNYKIEHLLRWDDLNSMAFSVESRVPFMDHHLVEKTLALKPHYKIQNGTTKQILRQAAHQLVPSKIINRQDKKGFTTPSDEWLREPILAGYVNDMIHSASFRNRQLFDVAVCEKKLDEHLKRKSNYSKEIWKWINIERWFSLFVDE
ncbi:asparagine synthase (glutamine-hydrolyzing) [Carboxylicivirga taeanensis]|uniref:asparagine synthase (glutamine-hydrolyzing) n=1 Tax=Carboxylicivirga taeanensis TaxID=1416875 RepID=UPI003F6DFC1C